MNLIEVRKLNYSYPTKKNTLKNISFEVEEGSITCIVGENGSGKSTLIKCILGLIKGYTGEISKDTTIGYLPQKSAIQSSFPATIEEVVLSGTISRNVRSIFYKKDDKEVANEIMKKLRIYDIRKKSFSDLSGGQQQRVLIARSLCASKKLIILDEPTNGLDPSIAIQIYKLLSDLRKKEGLTVLMVSHDIERALKYADKVIEIKNGQISYEGQPSEYKLGGEKNV
ncbi:MAG: metal ABC transporter ATP-binding protein [Clostridia bacterium]|nr:metal ABC transporter ATP-binding protein [Clostridia bacterium]